MQRRLTCVQTLAPVLSISIIETAILPIMDRLVGDEIPNIRFNVAKSYQVLIDALKKVPDTTNMTLAQALKDNVTLTGSPRGSALIQEKILPNLEKLEQDDDIDVRFFATTAHQAVDEGEAMQA
jgi:serine/threonine-protein phosphatase 2A regulatory subunit A